MKSKCCAVFTVAALLAGCDPYQGIDVGYASFGHALTAYDVYHQDTEVKPRCREWAKETNPSDWKMMGVYSFNNGVGGFVGGTAGYAADAKIIGAVSSAKLAIGGGAYYMLAAMGEGAVAGKMQNDTMKHSDAQWCLLADAGGYHLYSHRQGQIILIRAKENGWVPPAPGSVVKSSDLPKDANDAIKLPPPPPNGG